MDDKPASHGEHHATIRSAMIDTSSKLVLGPFQDAPGYDKAMELDGSDPLSRFKERFVVTDPRLIYLDGNSLGRLPDKTQDLVAGVVADEWGDRLIRSWNEGWWDLQLRLGDLLAPIIGADPGEVIISDSTSVNLFKLAYSAVAARPGKHKIITDDLNFPTDVYVLGGVAGLFGDDYLMQIVESDGVHGPVPGLADAIDDDTALVSLSHTVFKSGYTYDMSKLTRLAHESGALVLWDCSHSVGAVPIDFEGAGVDLAIGCTYKYLNGGPGSPAFLYVRKNLQDELSNPITAWWGHSDPFAFDLEFEPVSGIRRFHTGTMPMLSLAAAEPGIADVVEAGMGKIRTKSVALTEYFIELWETHLASLGFKLGSPQDSAIRGSHISLTHDDAWPIARALIERAKVIPDFRAPDSLRFGFSPLYTSFVDVHTAAHRLRALVENEVHHEYASVKATVT